MMSSRDSPTSSPIRVGTASWTDPEFLKAGWYPPAVRNDPAARLHYYAERFSMVEVNATFYALPTVDAVCGWVANTPDDFRFHVKAHQVISGHPCDPERLPAPLRALPYTADAKGRIRRPSRQLRDAVIDSLVEASGAFGAKLGAVLVQLPPFVAAGERERDELAHIVDRLRPLQAAVEFRHRSWAEEAARGPTAALLRDLNAAWVCVDTPERDVASAMPRIVEVTSPKLAYLRMHGRNAEMWTKGRSVAERFNHDYTDHELAEWIEPVLAMADAAQEVAVVMNNNARDYALQAAARFGALLERARADARSPAHPGES